MSFAKSKRIRTERYKEEIPGPGTYGDYNSKSGPGYSMGTSTRKDGTWNDPVPAPGAYEKHSEAISN